MNPHVFSKEELVNEIQQSEKVRLEPDGRAIRLWGKIKIEPEHWVQEQYSGEDSFWVIAVRQAMPLLQRSRRRMGLGWISGMGEN
jgi:hypothetical protein